MCVCYAPLRVHRPCHRPVCHHAVVLSDACSGALIEQLDTGIQSKDDSTFHWGSAENPYGNYPYSYCIGIIHVTGIYCYSILILLTELTALWEHKQNIRYRYFAYIPPTATLNLLLHFSITPSHTLTLLVHSTLQQCY